jgi:tetratricopeptide (TPR) repeat protein
MNDPKLDEAYAARQMGNDARAVDICRRILAVDPTHRGAQSLIGLCMAEAGNVHEARNLLEEAVAVEPGNWRFLLNLSVLREIEGDLDAAINRAKEATAIASERFEPSARLGDLCGKRGDFEGAVRALDRALAINAGHPGLALRLAGAAYEIGQYDRSAQALDTFERIAPGHPEALRLRAHLARKRGDADAFVDAATKWLAADPASEAARVALAHGYAQREDYHRAVEIYRPLVQAHPQDADHAATFAKYLLWARDFEAAAQHYNRALDIRADHADAASGLARLSIFKGQLSQAAALARKAIESDPTNVDAYGQLALAIDSQLSDQQLTSLHRMAADPDMDPENRAIALFTAGDVHHRRKEYDLAFDAWQQANELKQGVAARSGVSGYDRRRTEELVDRLIAGFNAFPPRTPHPPTAGPTPIFIVGMPRSGTTLLDSALAGHADIASAGELPVMPSALDRFLAWAESAGWRGGAIPEPIAAQLRDRYRQQYDDYRIPDAAFVTDKQPLNILSVGLIRHLFPTAPIIHIRRNALETGFSIYRKNFTRSWSFSTSLPNIGHYYGQYVRLMTHWHAVLGDEMAGVQYEQLVRDFEGELRRLLAQFGLDWDPNCLAYHKHQSIVTTLSSTQVRKPPSEEHIDSTTPYALGLAPLKEALDEAGIDFS